MNWDDLKIVLAISRNHTESNAAHVLGMDQSTVGRRLNAIEASLGTVLFVRSRSGFRPTEAGSRIIQRAHSIENEILWLEDEAHGNADEMRGPVTIIGNHWTLNEIIQAGLKEVLDANNGLEVQFVAGSNHWSLTQGRPEVALWFEIEPRDAEFASPIGQVPYAVYVKDGLDPETVDWVTFRDPRAKRAPDRWLRKNCTSPANLALACNDAGLLLTAVQSGIGKGLLPCCLAERASGISRLPSKRPALIRTLHVHANADLVQTRRLQLVINWLRRNAQQTFADP
ncbi:LysR family transcriptional regulator [Yoonia algicola]|uniref:LysR family transcriptional regulator n=1 Tax=Yoonia algicola TaxID=3137368 RepID=A0AAN0M6X8_9RHOB